MSIRFNLKNRNLRLRREIVQWMNENIGPIEENKTWFWSVECYKEWCNNSHRMVDKAKEGIRIWKDCPEVTIAIMKWAE